MPDRTELASDICGPVQPGESTSGAVCSTYVLMRKSVRDHLHLIVTIALALVKRQHRREYSERITSRSDPATRAIARQITDTVLRHFDVARKPDRAIGPPLGSTDHIIGIDDRSDDCPECGLDRPDRQDSEQSQ